MASEMSSSMQSRRIGGGTPESEFSIECFQNYTPSEVFVQGLAGLVNQGDVESMIRAQKQMLQRFEKTNEMLLNCNALCASRLKTTNEDFKKHIKVMVDMKKDLDYIFKKIRNIKVKISQQYPEAYAEALPQRNSLAEEAEDDEESGSVVENLNVVKKMQHPIEKKENSIIDDQITVEYVQMEENIENGKTIENDLIKRICSIENPNQNDSSDCTSEDTG